MLEHLIKYDYWIVRKSDNMYVSNMEVENQHREKSRTLTYCDSALLVLLERQFGKGVYVFLSSVVVFSSCIFFFALCSFFFLLSSFFSVGVFPYLFLMGMIMWHLKLNPTFLTLLTSIHLYTPRRVFFHKFRVRSNVL